MSRFRTFVAEWLRKKLTPLSADADTSFYTWIKNTPYPLWRKEELTKKYEESIGYITSENVVTINKKGFPVVNRYCRVNSFQKDEVYPTYKAARAINSRTDEFKVRVGPIFKLIEKELFALPYFIKHTPVDERPCEIKRELYQEGANIIGTDYTSFESLFTREFMEAAEFQLYRYMTQNLDDTEWIDIVERVLGGTNVCQFRNKFTMEVEATRMSGEMCTSLGNSFANLMAMLFIAKEKGLRSVKGRVEGDDGIFTFYGPYPTPEDFAEIGLIIKIERYDKLTEGSFCGIIADEDEMINVTDPIQSLLDFGWTTRQYADASDKKKKELLKAKALSLAYQYPGCPVLASLARYGLRMTEGHHYYIKDMCEYERTLFIQLQDKFKGSIPYKKTGDNTRLLVQAKFGLTIEDQLSIEHYLDSKNDLSPLDCPAILSNCHKDAIDYYNRYVFEYVSRTAEVECPIYDNYSHKNKINSSFLQYEQQECYESFTCSKKEKQTFKKAGTGQAAYGAPGYNAPPFSY